MAEKRKYASINPDEASAGGGKFTIPAGAVCTVTENRWSTYGDEADERALVGNRKASDPCMALTVDIEDQDEPRTELLSAGTQHEPSRDGEYLEPGDVNLPEGCNAHVFLASVCDKKAHKSLAMDGADLVKASDIEGLKFVAGRKKIAREGLDSNRPALYAEEIMKLPRGGGKGKSGDEEEERPARRRGRDEEEERPRRSSKREKEDGGDDETDAQDAVLEVLDLPKFKKGLPLDKAFAAVHAVVRDKDNAKDIGKLIQDDDWMTSKKRPWEHDETEDGTKITLP